MADTPDHTVDLLQRWHHGDGDARDLLVQRNREWIYERVRARRGPLLKQHFETMDDFQDLVVRVLEYTPRFVAASRSQFRGLLARMIENLLADKARRVQRGDHREVPLAAQSQDGYLSLDPAVRTVTQPDAAAERSEAIAWLRLGLEFLPENDRHIVWQRHIEERSFVDISAEAGIEPDALRMRFSRAQLRLAGIIERLQRGELDALLADH